MCTCYSDPCKQTCTKVVIGVSVILGLLGLITAVFGGIQAGAISPPADNDFGFKAPDQSGFGLPVIVVGVIAIVTSLLGCATGKWKNPCFAIPFGILTFIIGLVLVIIGALIAGIGSVLDPDTLKSQICTNKDIMKDYTDSVDKVLCSSACACNPGPGGNTKDALESMDKDDLKKWGRVPTVNDLSGNDLTEYNRYKDLGSYLAPKVPFVWATQGGYNNYVECYQGSLKPSLKKNDADQTAQQIDQFLKQGGYEFLKQLENDYNCQGICFKPLFYVTRDISERPEHECIKRIFEEISAQVSSVGIISLITGIVSLVGFIGSFPLCTAYNNKDD